MIIALTQIECSSEVRVEGTMVQHASLCKLVSGRGWSEPRLAVLCEIYKARIDV